jgi:hypothetical protein
MDIIFTLHAESRIIQRKMRKEDVIYSIKSPDVIIKKYNQIYYHKAFEYGSIEVCCQKKENIL